jgi:hypothetical protein
VTVLCRGCCVGRFCGRREDGSMFELGKKLSRFSVVVTKPDSTCGAFKLSFS